MGAQASVISRAHLGKIATPHGIHLDAFTLLVKLRVPPDFDAALRLVHPKVALDFS